MRTTELVRLDDSAWKRLNTKAAHKAVIATPCGESRGYGTNSDTIALRAKSNIRKRLKKMGEW